MTKKTVDYNDVLSDLRAKRHEKNQAIESLHQEIEELDMAIEPIERLAKQQSPAPDVHKTMDILPTGIYEASAVILDRNGKNMKTAAIHIWRDIKINCTMAARD